jgi:hypothetical protein
MRNISLFVRKCLERDKRLRIWDLDTRQMIYNTVIEGAHGM